MFRLISLIAGVLFGIGMVVSGMTEPANVIAFLDVAGNWSPDLAFVMGGALAVFMPSYFILIHKRSKPVCNDSFCLTDKKKIDAPLITGAVFFGVGWGIAGICPGPAIASIANGSTGIVTFVIAMVLGMVLAELLLAKRELNKEQARQAI
ncbi:YeeE/YedE family protein [Vibrio gelatinilyticus]|nr:YeeE/YedE family protein [Vibrio gelatinilyticus]